MTDEESATTLSGGVALPGRLGGPLIPLWKSFSNGNRAGIYDGQTEEAREGEQARVRAFRRGRSHSSSLSGPGLR